MMGKEVKQKEENIFDEFIEFSYKLDSHVRILLVSYVYFRGFFQFYFIISCYQENCSLYLVEIAYYYIIFNSVYFAYDLLVIMVIILQLDLVKYKEQDSMRFWGHESLVNFISILLLTFAWYFIIPIAIGTVVTDLDLLRNWWHNR